VACLKARDTSGFGEKTCGPAGKQGYRMHVLGKMMSKSIDFYRF
jgi:hypothetical protein